MPNNPTDGAPMSVRSLREEAKRLVQHTDHAEVLDELIDRCKLKHAHSLDPELVQGIIRVSRDLIDLRVRRLSERGVVDGR